MNKFDLIQNILYNLIEDIQSKIYLSCVEFDKLEKLQDKVIFTDDIETLYSYFPKITEILKQFEY